MIEKDLFCELIQLHEKAMYRLAVSIVKSNADAEEVISEAIYRAYRNIDDLRNEGSFKPWILSIVHNTAVELIRKNTRIISTEKVPAAAYDNTESEKTSKLSVRKAIESLNQPYRTVVILFYYEDLPVAKIATITGKNAVAVKKQLSRAREMLREILKEDFNG